MWFHIILLQRLNPHCSLSCPEQNLIMDGWCHQMAQVLQCSKFKFLNFPPKLCWVQNIIFLLFHKGKMEEAIFHSWFLGQTRSKRPLIGIFRKAKVSFSNVVLKTMGGMLIFMEKSWYEDKFPIFQGCRRRSALNKILRNLVQHYKKLPVDGVVVLQTIDALINIGSKNNELQINTCFYLDIGAHRIYTPNNDMLHIDP